MQWPVDSRIFHEDANWPQSWARIALSEEISPLWRWNAFYENTKRTERGVCSARIQFRRKFCGRLVDLRESIFIARMLLWSIYVVVSLLSLSICICLFIYLFPSVFEILSSNISISCVSLFAITRAGIRSITRIFDVVDRICDRFTLLFYDFKCRYILNQNAAIHYALAVYYHMYWS